MGVKWTDNQKKAIAPSGKGTVVSAAAGSGKTAVLIERIINILCDKQKRVPADKLLAVTFTKDAAAQMRDKLNTAIEKKLAQDPRDEWLLQQYSLVSLAKIATIDSFCLDLVKDNMHKFDFQGGIRTLEDADSKQLLADSAAEAMEELCRDEPQDYALLDDAFGSGFEAKVTQMVKKLIDYFHTISYAERWKAKAMEFYESDEVFEMLTDHLMQNALAEMETAQADVERLRYYYNYCFEEGGKKIFLRDHYNALEKNFAVLSDIVSEMSLALSHGEWEKVGAVDVPKSLSSLRISKEKELSPAAKQDLVNAIAAAKTIRDSIKDTAKDILSVFSIPKEHYRENIRKSNRIFSVICKLEKRTEEISMEKKLEKNALDFSDIELMAKDLLVKETENGLVRTELAEEIRSSGMYRLIFLDEYQDVNDLQETIFKAISDTDSLDIMGKNVFLVGDVKQAIYRFRLTNPQLFVNCIEQAKDEKYKDDLEHISLKKNFRSRREVVGLTNFIFEQIMSRECGEVDYDEENRLEFGADYYTERKCPAQLLLVDPEAEVDKKVCGFTAEQLAAAKLIKQMLDSKEPVFDGGADRPCRPSDFCILIRNNKEKKMLTNALRVYGLDAFSEDTDGYIKSREISLALDMLRTVDNPMNDIALTAVMMSPVMNFTPDEMSVIREQCHVSGTREYKHIYQILSNCRSSKESAPQESFSRYNDMGSELLREKCAGAHKLIESLRYDSMSMGLERLIRRIFDVTDLMAVTSLYLDSDKKRANLRLLLEYASSYEQNGKDGVSGFLRYVDSLSDQKDAFQNAVTVTSGKSSVNIQTYHKSKGLEYPFVILCSLANKMIRDVKSENFHIHSKFGYALKFDENHLSVKRNNLAFDFIADATAREQKSEVMRLFYVGCTRAKERLIIVCVPEKKEKNNPDGSEDYRRIIKKCAEYDRIPADILDRQDTILCWVMAAMSKHSGREPLAQWLGMDLDFYPVKDNEKPVDVEYINMTFDDSDFSAAELLTDEEENKKYPAADMAIVQRLREKYAFEYDRERSMQPAKLTVTEITAEEKRRQLGSKDPEFYPNLPRLNDELDKLTAAERGTSTHKFMECADYNRAFEDVEGELERLVAEGFMTKREAKGVYTDRLKSFVKTDFFARMRASKDLRREQKFLAAVKDLDLPQELKNVTGGDGMIQGIADCIFKEEDGWVLVDYKTDNFRSREDMNKYGTQLALYKAAFELIYGEKVKSSYIYSFKLGEGAEFKL